MLPEPILTVSTRVSRYRPPKRPHFNSPRACSVRANREAFKNDLFDIRALAAAIQVSSYTGGNLIT